MNAEKEETALEKMYSDDFSTPRDTAQDALDKLEAYNQEPARILKDEITQTYATSSILFLIIGIVPLVFGVGLALLINRIITLPIQKEFGMLNEISQGHFSKRLMMSRKDEIGDLVRNVDQFAQDLQNNVVHIMQKIADGERIDVPELRDNEDEVGQALQMLVLTLRGLTDETTRLIQAAKDGNLSYWGDESKFKGQFNDIVGGINETLDSVLIPVNEAMRLAGSYAQGN